MLRRQPFVATGGFVREIKRVGVVGRKLRRDLTWAEVRSGHWFERTLRVFLAHRADRRKRLVISRVLHDEERAALAQRKITRTAFEAAALGTVSAALTTQASLLIAESEGALVLVALPLAGAAVLSDLVLRSVLHVGMACDLGDLYGCSFDEHNVDELVKLCGLALLGNGDGKPSPQEQDELGAQFLSRVGSMDSQLVTNAIGARLSSETVFRNAIPWVGLVTSALSSYRLTRHLGKFVQRYVVHRRALDRITGELLKTRPEAADLILEGLWFVFTADGRLTREETAVLSALLAQRGEDSTDMYQRFINDETQWLEHLRQFAPHDADARRQLLRGLQVAAALSHLTGASQLVLKRAADALDSRLELERQSSLIEAGDQGLVPAFA